VSTHETRGADTCATREPRAGSKNAWKASPLLAQRCQHTLDTEVWVCRLDFADAFAQPVVLWHRQSFPLPPPHSSQHSLGSHLAARFDTLRRLCLSSSMFILILDPGGHHKAQDKLTPKPGCRVSISVSMPACHAGELGSIPRRGGSPILPTRNRVVSLFLRQMARVCFLLFFRVPADFSFLLVDISDHPKPDGLRFAVDISDPPHQKPDGHRFVVHPDPPFRTHWSGAIVFSTVSMVARTSCFGSSTGFRVRGLSEAVGNI